MMGRLIACGLAIGTLALLTIGPALSDDIPDALVQKLTEFNGAERGHLTPITDQSLSQALRGDRFYALRFRRYPVAVEPPESLGANNLFVVKPDGTVDRVPDAKALEAFFRSALPPVTTTTRAIDTVKAWLRLTQEFHQDGFFQFSIPDESIIAASGVDGGLQVGGRAVVQRNGGNSGEITVALGFDRTGRLATVSEVPRLRRGVRPICQATKLLDADPIVRRMAEQDLLVLGTAAKDYLDEQRARANPELRQAIDLIWQRILTLAT